MVPPAVGKVILVPFPFSDLSESKLRPALVLADEDAATGFRVRSQANRTGISTPSALRMRALCPARSGSPVLHDQESCLPQVQASSLVKSACLNRRQLIVSLKQS